MAKTPKSNKTVNNQQKHSKLHSPKRGAIPTPRAEIEKAKPYVPDTDPTTCRPLPERALPTNDDEGEENNR